MTRKDIYYRLYDNSNNYIDTFTNFIDSGYSASINSGYANLHIQIPKKFDDIFQDINFNGIIERYVSDKDEAFLLTYKGYITQRNAKISNTEYTGVELYGLWSQLSRDVVTTASDIFLRYTTTDTGIIVRNLLNLYKVNNPNTSITFSTTTIPTTGIVATMNFRGQTYSDAINETKDQAGANYYTFLDNDNNVYLRTITTTGTPTHYFTMGRDIINAEYQESIVELQNGIYFWNGATDATKLFKRYNSTASIATYGRSIALFKDARYSTVSSITNFANKYFGAFAEPLVTLNIDLADNNYSGEGGSQIDIEAIKPGDTFQINNIDSSSPFANKIYYITQVRDNNGKTLSITSVDPKAFLTKSIYDLNRKLEVSDFGGSTSLAFN